MKIVSPATTSDYRLLAQKRLPRFLFDYVDGGSNGETTLQTNTQDFQKVELKQRVMKDVSNTSCATSILGQSLSMPLALAPVGMAGMMCRRGETIGARVAHKLSIPFSLSTLGICSIQEVNESSPSPCWFQLYMLKDRAAVESLLQRALDNGSHTLVFTVDLAVTGIRHRDTRSGMIGNNAAAMALNKCQQIISRPKWVLDVALKGKPHTVGNLAHLVPNPTDLNAYKNWIDSQFDPSVTWEDIKWLRDRWPGKLILKGIMEPADALMAVDAGADAVIVSNHGGRQLDGTASPLSKLPLICETVGQQVDVLMDGGVRNGIDVVKAVALGAKAVMIGRPWIWAAASQGEAGLEKMLLSYQQEISTAMSLMGVNRIDQLSLDTLENPHLFDRPA